MIKVLAGINIIVIELYTIPFLALLETSESGFRCTNLEIIVTATLFCVDIYVASDTYRAGKPTWLSILPIQQQPQSYKVATLMISPEFHYFQHNIHGWKFFMFQAVTLIHLGQSMVFTFVDHF